MNPEQEERALRAVRLAASPTKYPQNPIDKFMDSVTLSDAEKACFEVIKIYLLNNLQDRSTSRFATGLAEPIESLLRASSQNRSRQ